MDTLRHSPQDLTCNRQRTGFYSGGTWCAATLHRPAKATAETRPAILMLHGWGGIQDALTVSYYEEFPRAGYVVMTFDYRGWGDSAGLPLLEPDPDRNNLRANIYDQYLYIGHNLLERLHTEEEVTLHVELKGNETGKLLRRVVRADLAGAES